MMNITKITVFVSVVCGLASCTEESVYDPDYARKEYDAAFAEKFGQIPADQSWDFYAQAIGCQTRDASGVSVDNTIGQPADGLDFGKWNELLPSNYDNRNVGTREYTLTSPTSGNFKVYAAWYCGWYPYYKKYNFELGLLVDGEHVKLFDGANVDREPEYDVSGNKFSTNPGYGASVSMPAGTQFTFYLSYELIGSRKYVYGNGGNSTLVYDNTSTTGNQLMIVGFEDTEQSTWGDQRPDFNDIVLYIEGAPELPIPEAKRFMCEDMGAIGDFDYNDVVFDVKPAAEAGKATVTILAAGGTYPAVLTVYGQQIGEVHQLLGQPTTEMINTKSGAEAITPYSTNINVPNSFNIAAFNDIKVAVTYPDGSTRDIVYQEDGSAPCVIITPIGTRWMQERLNIKLGYPSFFGADWFNNCNEESLF